MPLGTVEKKDKPLDSNFLLKNLYKQRNEGVLCDVELHAEGSIARVHGCVLASQSEYFVQRFQPQNVGYTPWDNHWCSRKPLVINLDSEMDDMDQHCFPCLSKVIDFMYLRELVIMEGHCIHFSKYAQFLKVIELIKLCKNYDKNLSLITCNSKVKSKEECKSIRNNVQSCSTREGSLNLTSSEVKCEFLCCNKDVEELKKSSQSSKRRRISCELCNFQTVSIKALKKHIESSGHFGTKCPICKLQMPNGVDLKDHLKDHVGAKPYLCHICKKRTRFWDTYRLHLRVHCRNKPFFCSICQIRFKEKKNLVVHMESHSESCYLCECCNYLTSDFKAYKSHLKQHLGKSQEIKESSANNSISDKSLDHNNGFHTRNEPKKFLCQACGKGFTLKKNLKRHVHLKHFSDSQHSRCPMCDYIPKRLDMLKRHMVSRHDLEKTKIEEILNQAKSHRKLKQTVKGSKQSSDILGVLIPVQLVSIRDTTTLNAFAIKAQEGENSSDNNTNVNVSVINNSDHLIDSIESNVNQNTIIDEFIVNSTPENIETDFKSSTDTYNINELCNGRYLDSSQNKTSNVLSEMNVVMAEENQTQCRLPVEAADARKSGDIWLNESTGELLSGGGYMNLHLLNSECSTRQELSSLGKTTLDANESFKTLLLNDQTREISVHEEQLFSEDKEDYFSNPETPQTNLVDFEDSDNLINWNCLENTFFSTWVLNEATGELNMVSFNVKPFNNSDELQINKTRDLSAVDDDDTALFLNEGTGDLSVIYFNPQNPIDQVNDKICQEAFETVSDHSDDEEIDFLNEELLRVSNDFMADDGNEKFLNELTGEFDVASYSRFQTDVLDYLTPDNSVYLNEETGEISWNVVDQDANSDIMNTHSDALNLEFEDSMNCEEFNNFPAETDFPSQFCMESTAPNAWQNMDESCGTLLNECTGELVQKP